MSKEKEELFVGIDSGKKSHQVSFMNPTKVKQDLRIQNNRQGFKKLTERLKNFKEQGYLIKVACESCGHYWENLGYHLKEIGYHLCLINPFHVSRYKEIYDNTPQKDDLKDSRIIATLLRQGRSLNDNLPNDDPYGELRRLTHHREDLLKESSRLRNKLHRWIDRYFPEYTSLFSNLFEATSLGLLEEYKGPEGMDQASLKELTKKIYNFSYGNLSLERAKEVKEKAAHTIGQTVAKRAAQKELNYLLFRIHFLLEELKKIKKSIKGELAKLEGFKYLISIPGVGWRTAAVFLGEVGDPKRLPRAKSVEKLAGLNLWRNQSGKTKSGLHITRRGRSLLRKTAYLLAVASIGKNREFTEFYQRKLDRGKAKPNALVALGAKILRVMYGVVKNEECYRPLGDRIDH